VKSILGGGDTEKNWRKTLNDGLIASTAFAPVAVTSKFSPASMAPAATQKPGELEFIFRPDPTIYDGRFANNGWLQELAKPQPKRPGTTLRW